MLVDLFHHVGKTGDIGDNERTGAPFEQADLGEVIELAGDCFAVRTDAAGDVRMRRGWL